jgi:hypothetical protein
MIVVHHLNNSRSQRILWLLEELGLPYEIKFYQRAPKTNGAPAELKAVHPLGRFPIIREGEKVVTESKNDDAVHDLSNLHELVLIRRHIDIATHGVLQI